MPQQASPFGGAAAWQFAQGGNPQQSMMMNQYFGGAGGAQGGGQFDSTFGLGEMGLGGGQNVNPMTGQAGQSGQSLFQQFQQMAKQNQGAGQSFSDFMGKQGWTQLGPGDPAGAGFGKLHSKGQFGQNIMTKAHQSTLDALHQQWQQGQQGNMLGDMVTALGMDMDASQQAANMKFAQGQANLQQFQQWLPHAAGHIASMGTKHSAQLGADVDFINKLGAELASMGIERADEMLSTFDAQSAKAVNRMEGALLQYQNLSNQMASAATAGMSRAYQQSMQLIQAGVAAGAMPPEAANQQVAQLNSEMNQAIASQTLQIKEQFNQTSLQAGMQIGNVMANLAGVRAQTAGQAAQIAMGGKQQQIGAAIAGAQLNQSRFQIEQGAHLAAMQFKMQGFVALDQMIQNNAKGVVSVLAGLSQIFAAATAPGAQQVPSLASFGAA